MGQIVAVDLFCGIGGLTRGLENSGIKVVAGFDNDESCRYAYEMNNNSLFFKKDVTKLKGEDLLQFYPAGSLKVLAGCAPCQPYSSVGKGKKKHNKIDDEPLKAFARLVSEIRPEIVTMENVPNLIGKPVFLHFIRTLRKAGFTIWYNLVFAPDYGVPQSRRRLVLLASRIGWIEMVPPVYSKHEYLGVKDAISHLEEIPAGGVSKADNLHRSRNLSPKNMERIRSSRPGGTWNEWGSDLIVSCHKTEKGSLYKAVYGRMSWENPSPTITTQFFNYGSGRFGHPEQDRALSLREGAILQTFPPDYEFLHPKERPVFETVGRWIGNAVPVKLAESIGNSIVRCAKENWVGKSENRYSTK